jgi:hypothetical protein
MAAVPIYVWNGTAWQETGPTIPASPIKYQASAPTSPSTGDIWVDSDADVTSGSQQFQRFRFVASGGETTISGADANGAVLAYTAGAELVVLNGSTLVRGQDYTATNGTSITGLSPALVANDVLEVFSFIAFNVANTYTQSQVDGLVSATPGMKLIVPTSATNGTVGASGAVTFTSVSSVSLDGVFSSTYDNYKIVAFVKGSADAAGKFRFRTSGSDNTTSNYWWGGYYQGYGSTTTINPETGGGAVNAATISGVSSLAGGFAADVFSPYLTDYTLVSAPSADSYNRQYSIQFRATTSFDGFTFYPGSGTITGTIRVYGYKN